MRSGSNALSTNRRQTPSCSVVDVYDFVVTCMSRADPADIAGLVLRVEHVVGAVGHEAEHLASGAPRRAWRGDLATLSIHRMSAPWLASARRPRRSPPESGAAPACCRCDTSERRPRARWAGNHRLPAWPSAASASRDGYRSRRRRDVEDRVAHRGSAHGTSCPQHSAGAAAVGAYQGRERDPLKTIAVGRAPAHRVARARVGGSRSDHPRRGVTRGLGRSYGDASLPAREARASRRRSRQPHPGLRRGDRYRARRGGLSLVDLHRTLLPRGGPPFPGTQLVRRGWSLPTSMQNLIGRGASEPRPRLKLRLADGGS